MDLVSAVEVFLGEKRRAGRSVGTLALYRRQLTHWTAWRVSSGLAADLFGQLPADQVAELRSFFRYLRDDHQPYGGQANRPARLADATLASYHRTIRACWFFLADEGILSADQRAVWRRIAAPHVAMQPRAACDHSTLDRLLAACGDGHDEESARNRAMLLLLVESGMRIAEACSLTDRATDIRQRRAKIRGKGDKYRAVFWTARAAGALARYLLLRRGPPYDRSGAAPLFRGCSWRNNGQAVTPNLVRSLIKRLADRAEVDLPLGAPLHFLRHGFAHDALAAGADISEVSQLLGHADISTTMRYLRDDDDRLHDTYDRIFRQRRAVRRFARSI